MRQARLFLLNVEGLSLQYLRAFLLARMGRRFQQTFPARGFWPELPVFCSAGVEGRFCRQGLKEH